MDPTPCARPTRRTPWLAASIACAMLSGCDGVREISARAATRLAESLGSDASTATDAGPITPGLAWAKNGFGAADHELDVRAPSGTRVFVGAQEETVGASGTAHFNLTEAQVVERAGVQLVAPDGSVTRLPMPEIAGPRLADVVRFAACFSSDDGLGLSSPLIGKDGCMTSPDAIAFEVPMGARATFAGETIAADRSGATFSIDVAALALAHGVRLGDSQSPRTREPDLELPLRVQWRGQTLETTVAVRYGKRVVDLAVRSTIGLYQGEKLALPGTSDAKADGRTLIAVVGDQPVWVGRPGTIADVDLVALHELLAPRADGRCGPYGQFSYGTDYYPRNARDERWTVYDARTRAVVASQTFKAKRAECPFSVRKDDDTVITSSVDRDTVTKWLGGFAEAT